MRQGGTGKTRMSGIFACNQVVFLMRICTLALANWSTFNRMGGQTSMDSVVTLVLYMQSSSVHCRSFVWRDTNEKSAEKIDQLTLAPTHVSPAPHAVARALAMTCGAVRAGSRVHRQPSEFAWCWY